MTTYFHFENLCHEAIWAVKWGDRARAARFLEQAQAWLDETLSEPTIPKVTRPEDDPTRPAFDREAWRQAR